MRDRAKGVNKLRVSRHHAVPTALPVADRYRRLGTGELQVTPLQVEGFRLTKRGPPEQQTEEPRLTGRHGVQDRLHLVGGPVVRECSRDHGVSLAWQISVQSLPLLLIEPLDLRYWPDVPQTS